MSKIFSSGLTPRDANMQALGTAGRLTVEDGASTALESPRTSIGSSKVLLTRPTNGVKINITPATQALRVGTNATHATGYMLIPAGERVSLPVADLTGVYIAANASTTTVYFDFETLS